MKFFRSYLLFAFIIIIHPVNGNTDYKIDHLEPPFWWTDMAENKLQLMVHGKNISKLEPRTAVTISITFGSRDDASNASLLL